MGTRRWASAAALVVVLGAAIALAALGEAAVQRRESNATTTTTTVDPDEVTLHTGTLPGDPTVPIESTTVKPKPVVLSEARMLVGMGEHEAADAAESKGWKFRVRERDGEALMVTEEYRVDRVNATVVGGTVTGVTVG